MNDLEGISVFQLGRGMRFTRHNITIELDHDASRADLQFIKQPSHIEPVRDLLLFSVDTNLHMNKKTVSANHPTVARENGFKFVPAYARERWRDCDSRASLRRRYPDQVRRVTWLFIRLSVRLRQTPLAFRDS